MTGRAELVTALRSAACSDLTANLRAELLAHAERLELEPDWVSIARALLVKYGGLHGQAIIGSSSLRWAKEHVVLVLEADSEALVLRWKAPSLKPEGV